MKHNSSLALSDRTLLASDKLRDLGASLTSSGHDDSPSSRRGKLNNFGSPSSRSLSLEKELGDPLGVGNVSPKRLMALSNEIMGASPNRLQLFARTTGVSAFTGGKVGNA